MPQWWVCWFLIGNAYINSPINHRWKKIVWVKYHHFAAMWQNLGLKKLLDIGSLERNQQSFLRGAVKSRTINSDLFQKSSVLIPICSLETTFKRLWLSISYRLCRSLLKKICWKQKIYWKQHSKCKCNKVVISWNGISWMFTWNYFFIICPFVFWKVSQCSTVVSEYGKAHEALTFTFCIRVHHFIHHLWHVFL